jgi:signal peptidase I
MKKSRWLSAILNFVVPGLGHYYTGNTKKFIVTYILFFLLVLILFRFVAYNFLLFATSIIIVAGAYVYLAISGYRAVDKSIDYEFSRFDKWYVYLGIFVVQTAVLEAIKGRPLNFITPINFAIIPTPAMDPTLQVGDRLSFKKTKTLARNDVVVFWFPGGEQWHGIENTMYIKRCIALPGDSLQIKGSTVFVNGMREKKTPFKFKHIVTTDGAPIAKRVLEEHGISENDYHKESPDTYEFFLTEEQATKLRKLEFLKGVELLIEPEGESQSDVYPKSPGLTWNTDFYGPIYIPKTGDKIELTQSNIDLYLKCIAHENESVEIDATGLIINGVPQRIYEFKEDYFFMMGDNRHNSLDSRYWGFLPRSLVIGKAMYIFWGKTSDRIGKEII